MDDLETRMKEKLLEGLIEHMHGKMGEDMGAKFPHKAMEVSVAAPDKEKLAEGLEHAKGLIGKEGSPEEEAAESPAEEEDEDRLMALLGEKDDDDKEA